MNARLVRKLAKMWLGVAPVSLTFPFDPTLLARGKDDTEIANSKEFSLVAVEVLGESPCG